MTPERVDRFLQLRQGPDGIDGTDDDMIKSPDEARAALGLNQEQFNELTQLGVSFKTVQVFRVVSVGTAGKATRTIQMVFQRTGTSYSSITWKEF
jgi:hypothetical protein